jgi:psiF repeat
MKFATSAAACILAMAFAGSAFAADAAAPAKPLTPQQQRMKDCNAQATGKKGDERKAFMSTCLKGGDAAAASAAAPPKPLTQQEKMKVCNTQAADKKGDDRKAFMSTCLKGDGSVAPAAH